MQVMTGIAAALSLVFWAGFCWRGTSWTKTAIKTASVAVLALAAWGQGMPGLAAALALGAAGDFCLSREGERWFLAGMAAFAAAHLFYVALLWPSAIVVRPGAWLVLLVFGSAMAVALWRRAGALRVPVLGYVGVILAMGIAALAQSLGHEMLIWAALLFILSDSLLATELFLLPRASRWRPVLPFLVWPTYWLAQVGFLFGFSAI